MLINIFKRCKASFFLFYFCQFENLFFFNYSNMPSDVPLGMFLNFIIDFPISSNVFNKVIVKKVTCIVLYFLSLLMVGACALF